MMHVILTCKLLSQMRVARGGVPYAYRRNRNNAARSSRCACSRAANMTPQIIALIVLGLSLYPSHDGYSADSLAFPGRRLVQRRASIITDAEIELELRGAARDENGGGEPFDLSGGSPAFGSPLFTSPTYRRDRRRQRVMALHRNRLFRREGNFQLNYKDHDDDILGIIESQQPVIRGARVFPWRRRKSLSKAMFPLEPEESDDLASVAQLDVMQGDATTVAEDEEASLLPTPAKTAMQTGIGKVKRKKRTQVSVSTIDELREAILDNGLELRDVELNYSPPPSLLTSKKQETAASSVVTADSTMSSMDEVQLVLLTNELSGNYAGPDVELEDEPNAEEWQLIGNVLAEDSPFANVETPDDVAGNEVEKLFSHDVLNLLHHRYITQSTPKARAAHDTSILALSIEGGGMRGAVSGGMAAAIACLGLSNAFDSIYGSSAGSIIGSYFVSRQLYLDVYTDVIPAGKDLFVSKAKIIGDMFRNAFHVAKAPIGKRLNANLIERFRNPAAGANMTSADTLPPTRAGGLNISFVLDSIMCPERGLRPLDLEAFAHNDAIQPLRIVSSAVELETGKLKSIVFGSKEGHFRDDFVNPAADKTQDDSRLDPEYLYPAKQSAEADKNGYRHGLWASLGASMTVPGAAGSPFLMDLPSSDTGAPTPHLAFDAFCYEPIPFRSAVAEGATHVLALRSRPAGFEPKTKPTLYERAAAPLYFRSQGVKGVNTVAEFFEKGGQQYLYAEDVLMCDQGLNSTEPIPIPPAKVLYAAPEGDVLASDTDREKWARAHLLPITVPADVPELSTLSQDRDDILAGIRSGFAAAYDALAPVVGLETGPGSLDGMKVAELVFPDADAPHESVLERQLLLAGEKLGINLKASAEGDATSASLAQGNAESADLTSAPRRSARLRSLLSLSRVFKSKKRVSDVNVDATTPSEPSMDDLSTPVQDTDELLSFLPGLQLGRIPLVEERLQTYLESTYVKS